METNTKQTSLANTHALRTATVTIQYTKLCRFHCFAINDGKGEKTGTSAEFIALSSIQRTALVPVGHAKHMNPRVRPIKRIKKTVTVCTRCKWV